MNTVTSRLSTRRLWALVIGATLIAAPAALLRGLCAGRSCNSPARAQATVPFCSLPGALRDLVRRGFRDGRSPDVLAVAARGGVAGGTAFAGSPVDPRWPSAASAARARVPLVFAGRGVPRGPLPSGITLDAVAPTLARVMDLHRPHPEVRSGVALPGFGAKAAPRLVLEVVWKGVGTRDLRAAAGAWPWLRHLRHEGTGTLGATAGSLPLDPAAVLTTIGTGGLPDQHGITGTLIRNDRGRLVGAWGRRSPVSVIAALGDDLDEQGNQVPKVGVVATDVSDTGVVGGNWYLDGDRDDSAYGGDPVASARRILSRGYGRDGVTDLVAVVAQGGIGRLDHELRRIVAAATSVSGGSLTTVVTATGSALRSSAGGAEPAAAVARGVERNVPGPAHVVEAAAPGGLYLDQRALARSSVSEDEIVSALRRARGGHGAATFRDSFPAIAVSFARYC